MFNLLFCCAYTDIFCCAV